MDILKKSSISKQPVLLGLGSRNNSILNKIKSNNIASNTNINMLKVIKNKNFKNKIVYTKNNFQTNQTSINKHIEQNNKDKLSNKFLSRVFSYRKIDKTNGVKNKEQKIIKNKDEENIDIPINNNVTNNITNNITNIFINNDNKKKGEKIIDKNFSEKNKKNKNISKIVNNGNNLTCSNSNKNKSLNEKNSVKNLKNMSIFNRNKYHYKHNKANTNEIKSIHHQIYNSNFINNFNLNNNSITGKNILNNLNISTSNNYINNTINTNNNINNTMSNYSCRIKYNKKKQTSKNSNNENNHKNEINNNKNNELDLNAFNSQINAKNISSKKTNTNLNINNNKNSKPSINFIDDININKNSFQCLKRNNTEKGILNSKENSMKQKKEKNFFSNQIYKMNSVYSNYHVTDYNINNNLANKNFLLAEPTQNDINNLQQKIKLTAINQMNSLANKKNTKLCDKNKINNYLNINIQNNNKPKSKSKKKEKYKNTIMNIFRNKNKKNNSLPKKLNNTNKNIINQNSIFNSYFSNTSKNLSTKNSISNRNNINNSSIKKINEYIRKPKNKYTNILTNNISLNSLNNPIKKDFYYLGNNLSVSNNNKKLNLGNIKNMIFVPFRESKKYTFNYASKEKNINEKEKNKKKEYYNNQTKIYHKKNLKNIKNNRCKNSNFNLNSDFHLEQKAYKTNKNSFNKIKNINSPTNNKNLGNQNINIINKDSILNDYSTSYNKNNSKKKKNIIINYKKNIKKKSFNNNNDNNNKIIVNQIIQNFKKQIKQNILSNEHIVKSERISPFKNEIISKKNKISHKNSHKNSYNISKDISKYKDKNSEKNKPNNLKNKIKNKSSLISQETKSEEKKEQNNSNINKEEKINFFEIEISDSKCNSSNKNSEKVNSNEFPKIEIKSGNHKICSLDSIETSKKKKKRDNPEGNADNISNKKKEEEIINIDLPIELKQKNPQYLNEYKEDILETLLIEENYFLKKKYINPHYLENIDSELTPEMRTVAVDWLVLIHHKIFKFKENTFFLAIQLFDRYLSDMILSIEKTELLLLTSFTLASKHEEVEYVNMQETLQLAQNKFSKEQVIIMEYEILKQIKFEVLAPTMCDFFKLFAFMINLNNDKLFQGFYILNIILVDFHMLEYPNCILALAVIKLINKKINIELFEIVKKIAKKKKLDNIEKFLNYGKINSICNKIKLLYDTFLETKYKNIPEKFSEKQYNCISTKTSI